MQFSNTYVNLGERFYQKSQPTPVQSPNLFLFNTAIAERLQMQESLLNDRDALAQYLSGNRLFEGAAPIACAYAGHQFSSFNPQLGDGRAHLLGELTDREGRLWDLQLKGSGPSAYSRSGDGRCALGPAIREFIMSEAMKALGVPTTECLAVVTSGETVYRKGPLPGAIVTRVASSHVRVGNFQYFAARGDTDSLRLLRDYCIARHFPEIDRLEGDRSVLLLDKAIERQIELVVQWMRVGFIHGVMNTDNTAISGDTIDFGPCAMLGVYRANTVYSSIDATGRYAFGNQGNIAQWNMARFAESLLPLHDQNDASIREEMQALINGFAARFSHSYTKMMAGKLGFIDYRDNDHLIAESIMEQLSEQKMDYTDSFDLLTRALTDETASEKLSTALGASFEQWKNRVLDQDISREDLYNTMRTYNPVLIPRNHHVEAVLKTCEESGESTAAEAFLEVLRQPYVLTENTPAFQTVAEDYDQSYQTFCGT